MQREKWTKINDEIKKQKVNNYFRKHGKNLSPNTKKINNPLTQILLMSDDRISLEK